MRIRMLGPVRVWSANAWTPVAAPQQRQLLAALLVDAGQVVSTQRLAYEVWGDRPPRTALKTLHAYVMRLRRLLGDDDARLLVTRAHGYELSAGAGDLDAWEFERLVETGQKELAGGRPAQAAARFSEALGLWHGPALADVPASPAWAARLTQLEQARLAAHEDHAAALIELGRHAEAINQLHRLVEQTPLRERLWAQLMQAQLAVGQRADAMATFQRVRRVVHEELGLEPGPALQQLQREILAAGRPVAEDADAPATVVVARQLPAGVNGFTGRHDQLAQLDRLLPTGDRPAGPMPIAVIAGTAGVGKTALAVHWAHRAGERFPDGHLYINLRGYADAPPVQPVEALARFLRALGVPPEQIPSDVDEASAVYRSRLAGRRVLVLLDNAHHPEQVRPLLPGSPGCLALVTSRDRLAGLTAREGAGTLGLDTLSAAEAQLLLARLVGAERVRAEPDPAAELARLCDHLPLALRIAAANLSVRPHTTLAGYLVRLRRNRLAGLQLDGDPRDGVRAAFDLSYSSLPGETRRQFRLLGLHPGADLTVAAAAALAGVDLPVADRSLARLSSSHLLEEHAAGRYVMHDLLRDYAADLAGTEETEPARGAALDRLFAHYQRQVDAAARLLYPEMTRLPDTSGVAAAGGVQDAAAAAAWLDAEIANLVAVIGHTAGQGPHPVAWRLADVLRGYFFLRVSLVDWRGTAAAALAAARAAGDPGGLAATHLNYGSLESVCARRETAIGHYRQAAGWARRTGWSEGEAAALGNVGGEYLEQGRLREAEAYYGRSLLLHQRAGSDLAVPLENLGHVHFGLGNLELAAGYHARAAALHRRIDSPQESRPTAALGTDYHLLGRLPEARTLLTAALAVQETLGDYAGAAYTQAALAEVHRDHGDHGEAARLVEAALVTGREIEDLTLEAVVLTARASLHRQLRHPRPAIDDLARALECARENTDRLVEAWALVDLSDAHRLAGEHGRAIRHADQALGLARGYGYRLVAARARIVVAAICLAERTLVRAEELAQRARYAHTRTGHRLGQAHALLLAGHASRLAGRDRPAESRLRTAHRLFAGIGADPAVLSAVLAGDQAGSTTRPT